LTVGENSRIFHAFIYGCYFQIKKLRSPLSQPAQETSIHGVGVSIAFEKIVLAVLESKEVSLNGQKKIFVSYRKSDASIDGIDMLHVYCK
jgi:hypothetical protein